MLLPLLQLLLQLPLLLLILLLPLTSSEDYSIGVLEGEEVEQVRVVQGYNVSLPCNVKTPYHDQPTLTLWYIGEEEAPVYSYDERPGVRGSEWADRRVLGDRASFHPHHTPPSLTLTHTHSGDERMYRCRVDFKNTRSRVSWVNLTVIVPPHRVEILSLVSPVGLGDKNDVICKSFGGSPAPQVVWLQEGREVDSSYTTTHIETYNVLQIQAKRGDLTHPFTCTVSNNDLTHPIQRTYRRNVTCPPLTVAIEGAEIPMTEGRGANLTCVVTGSSPPPKITWLKDNKIIDQRFTKVAHGDNITSSVLSVMPTRIDNMKKIICKAMNEEIREEIREDSYLMDVQYKPRVSIALGRSLSVDHLQENQDLFLVCDIQANPEPYKVEWLKNGKIIEHNVSAGVLISGSTLALQRVNRTRSGAYQCSASNVEGDTTSTELLISIKYAPRCTVAPSLRGAPLRSALNLTCQVDSDPDLVTFVWTFSNSLRSNKILKEGRYITNGLKSTMEYTPTTERDYGTILCYAKNTVGTQKVPCSFTVVSAGPPEEVSGCGVENITSDFIVLSCFPGFDGGLPQMFRLEVWDDLTRPQLVLNTTQVTPEFVVRSLLPGHHYKGQVTAFNRRGEARPVSILFFTLKEAEMHKSLPSRSEPSAVMLVVAVIGGVMLVVVSCLVAGVWGVRWRRGSLGNDNDDDDNMKSRVLLKESNPDILETGPSHPTSTTTTTTPTTPPITISIITPPPPPHYHTAPTSPLSIRSGGGVERRGGTLPNQRSYGNINKPIQESLQRSLRGLSSQHLT